MTAPKLIMLEGHGKGKRRLLTRNRLDTWIEVEVAQRKMSRQVHLFQPRAHSRRNHSITIALSTKLH